MSQSAEFWEAERLNRQAVKLFNEGRYAEAIPLAERALALVEKALGPDHLSVAGALNNLAAMHYGAGDFERVEPLFQRSLAILEKSLGPNHPLVAGTLDNLGALSYVKGNFTRAGPFHERAMVILEKSLGANHLAVAGPLSNLALVRQAMQEYGRAELLFQRALAILEKSVGASHPKAAGVLNNLTILYNAQGEYERAEPLIQRAIVILERAFGTDHPEVAGSLNNLATTYYGKGEYGRAEPVLQRTLAIFEKAYGPNHPLTATPLLNLAGLYYAKGDFAQAVRFLSRGSEVREQYLSRIIVTGSERQKFVFLATFSDETDGAVSLHVRAAPADLHALQLSLTTILRRKGRTLEAMTNQVASLRRRLSQQDRALLDQLSSTQSQLSAHMIGGLGKLPPEEYQLTASRLEERVERLQDAISRRSAEFRAQTQPITIEQVRQALPPDASLIEFFSYKPIDPKKKTPAHKLAPARYVVYVLHNKGEPLWVDLGEASTVDVDITKLLRALKCPQTVDGISDCPSVPEVKRLARSLDERVMRPVRKLMGGARHIFISPDGALNLLPFAALVDERGKYLVENYSLTYLTSGRDLLRLQLNAESREPPLIVADPAFGKVGQSSATVRDFVPTTAQARRSADMVAMDFDPLPATAAEARALASLLPGARVLTQEQATEAALKQVRSPRVLHIATHGFFLPDEPEETADGTRAFSLSFAAGGIDPRVLPRSENPLLRSGLALAGANLPPDASGEDDGILTALEASALDLWGTKLVVLSACETGVGQVRNGEGVYGLRRALVLAGSESQVMSLWQISDEATRDLMVGYYKRLLAGEGRTEALRQVQLEILRGRMLDRDRRIPQPEPGATAKKDYSHPYYWAAFIQSGEWRSMTTRPDSP